MIKKKDLLNTLHQLWLMSYYFILFFLASEIGDKVFAANILNYCHWDILQGIFWQLFHSFCNNDVDIDQDTGSRAGGGGVEIFLGE